MDDEDRKEIVQAFTDHFGDFSTDNDDELVDNTGNTIWHIYQMTIPQK